MTSVRISASKFNTSCISPHPQKNYPSENQLSVPRNFLALKIVGKAQECDLSVTGHLIVDKPFRWLVSYSVLGCFEALPVCMLTYLQPPHSPCRCFPIYTYMCAFCSLDFTRKVLWLTALTKRCLPFSLVQELTSGSRSYFQFPSLFGFPGYQRL